MRRAKPISVRVRAPSRGLVSRLPGESADQMLAQGGIAPGTMRRAASRASNVRYEDGVVCNAPGYEVVALKTGLLTGLVAQWNMNETAGSRLDVSGNRHTLLETPGLDVPAGNVVVPVGFDAGKVDNSAVLAAIAPRPCPVYTPGTITWSNAAGGCYGLVGVESARRLFVSRPDGASLVSIISTLTDSYVGTADLDAAAASVGGFFGLGLIYAPSWGTIFAIDQRGYYAGLDPVSGLVHVPSPTTPNRVAHTAGPTAPPGWFDMAFDSDRGLVVFSPLNASYVCTVPLSALSSAGATSTDFAGLSWTHQPACCYNPAVKKVVFCNYSSGTSPYWFFDTGTGALTQSSLVLAPFYSIFYVPELGVMVGAAENGILHVIDAATDTVLASTAGTIAGYVGGVVYNPCSGLLYALTVSSTNSQVVTFDPGNSWASVTAFAGFGASSMVMDRWAGARYCLLNNSETVKKV